MTDTDPHDAVVTHEADRSRYTVHVGDRRAGLTVYGRRAGRYFFVHTEIDEDFSGQGIGTALARQALDDVRARGGRVIPLCPFIAGFVDRHPEYHDLLDEDLMARIDDGRV